MVAILLYLFTSIGLIGIWRRFVQPMSRAAAIVLVLLPFCFVGRALLTARVYAPIDMPLMAEPLRDYRIDYGIDEPYNGTLSDLYMQMIPWQSAVRQALAHGEWPLWNRHMLAGSVLAANMQAAPYDPLQLIGFLIPHSQALTFGAAMTFFIAGLFTFAFARSLSVGETASLIGAAAYMFSAMLAFFVGWPIGRAWTYLPLVFLGVRMVVHETNVRAAVILTSAFVLTIFTGHPESVLHIVVLGMIYGVFELWRNRSAKAVALAVISGVLALMLTSILLLPFFAAAPETVEYYIRHELYAKHDLILQPGAVGHRALRSLFPFYGGQPERGNFTPLWDPTSIRVGSIVLALALTALLLARKRRETWFFLGFGIFTILAGLNAWPIAHVLHALPGFDIALNERLVFAAAFALAMLAAFAVDAWGDRRAAGIVFGVAIALAIGSWLLRDSQMKAGVDGELIAMLTLVEHVPLAIVAILFALRTPARIALPLILGLVLLQRTWADGSIYPAHPEKLFYPDIPILRHIKEDAQTPFRIVGLHFAFLPDAAALYGLEDVRGYEAMTFKRLYETYPLWCKPQDASFNRVFETSPPFLSMMNVKYALGSLDPQPNEQWKLALQDRNSRLLENTRVLPRAFIPQHIRYEKTAPAVFLGMSATKDFGERSFLHVPHYPAHTITNGPGKLTIRREYVDYDIDAEMDLDGWVIISESAWPGWRAYIDGKRVEWQYANHAFIGVFVPKGKHHLRLVYVPEAFTRGRRITFFTLAGLLVLAAMHRMRPRFRGWAARRTPEPRTDGA